jgi:cellulose synthase/poly-beta-1,6-N-acetylglucosamine synthase-like glycosyltransferase
VDVTVSVVVPAYNQAAFLPRAIASLFAQDFPLSRYEIIVVDDGSTDGAGAVAERLAATWTGAMRVLTKHNGGPASARNMGVAQSQAEIVAFMDADCCAAPNWLSSLVCHLTETAAAGVGGPISNARSANWVASYTDASGLYRHRVRRGMVDYLLTANVAFRRSALVAVGGFSEHAWAEDADLSFRLRAAGHTLLLAADGIVVHYGAPTSTRALRRELYRYGHGSYWQSRHWGSERAPLREFIRHAGAIALSPLLALRLTPRLGVWGALRSWPLVAIEHGAFCQGLLAGHLSATVHRPSGSGAVLSQRRP